MEKLRLTLLIGIITSLFSVSVQAEHTRAEVTVTNHGQIKDGIERAPFRLPTIEVYFDRDALTLQVVSSIDCDASVYLYDDTGNLIESADSMDTLLYLPVSATSMVHLRIESERWYATADIWI